MKLTIRESIAAPVDEVFAIASDFPHAAEFVSGITKVEMLTDGPVGVGTRFRETRVMYGREATEEMEVTGFEPPNSVTLGCESHGCRYRSVFTFEPTKGGTDVRLEFEATPLTAFAKVMSFLMKPAIKGVAKAVEQDLRDIKSAAERG